MEEDTQEKSVQSRINLMDMESSCGQMVENTKAISVKVVPMEGGNYFDMMDPHTAEILRTETCMV
jgi:hypothetical protein